MAISENSAKVFEFLKGFVGQKTLTIESIAEETGLSAKSVNGTLLALHKHGLFERVPSVTEEGVVIKYIVPTEAINTYDPYAPSASDLKKSGGSNYSEATKSVIKLLKSKLNSTENFTAKDIADSLGLPLASVNGSLTGLGKKGFIERLQPTGVMIDGKAVNVRYIKVLPAINDAQI